MYTPAGEPLQGDSSENEEVTHECRGTEKIITIIIVILILIIIIIVIITIISQVINT